MLLNIENNLSILNNTYISPILNIYKFFNHKFNF